MKNVDFSAYPYTLPIEVFDWLLEEEDTRWISIDVVHDTSAGFTYEEDGNRIIDLNLEWTVKLREATFIGTNPVGRIETSYVGFAPTVEQAALDAFRQARAAGT